MTSLNQFQSKQWVHRITLKNRVPRGERFPLDPNDYLRKWWNTPGVKSVADSTTFHYDGDFVEMRSDITVTLR